MKIAIYYNSPLSYASKRSLDAPLPGTERAVLMMASAFQKLGHSAKIITRTSQLVSKKVDVLIVKRNPIIPLSHPEVARTYYYWSPDLTEEPSFLPLQSKTVKKHFIHKIQMVLAISRFQGNLYKKLGIPKSKIYISRNGVNAELFRQKTQRNTFKCMYVSTYCDGLPYLFPIWEKIISQVPQAQLHIIAARSLYGEKVPSDILFHLNRLKRLGGVVLKSPMRQGALARELMETNIFLYPNTLEETSSMTTLEARAAGCIIVTSKRGALPESAAGNIVLGGHPSAKAYQTKAAAAVIDIMKNPKKYASLRTSNSESVNYYNWQTIAQEWESLFLQRLKEVAP